MECGSVCKIVYKIKKQKGVIQMKKTGVALIAVVLFILLTTASSYALPPCPTDCGGVVIESVVTVHDSYTTHDGTHHGCNIQEKHTGCCYRDYEDFSCNNCSWSQLGYIVRQDYGWHCH